jgi:periplasmic protein TonB
MFENTLSSSWDERSRRGLTALTSFGVQVLAVAILLIVPLLRPNGIPLLRQLSAPISLAEAQPEPALVRARSVASSGVHSAAAEIVLRQPSQIPSQIATEDDAGPPPISASGAYIPGTTGTTGPGVFSSIGTGYAPVIPKPPVSAEHTVRLSHMSEGDLVRKVAPAYPPLARSARIQGTVVLQAEISKDGTIQNLQLISGHPMLAPAAIEAVKQWRYKPYLLNGEPVAVETQVVVNFSLSGG